MSLESIRNYILVSEHIASSGQPDDQQFKWIAQAGYQLVINLAMPNSDDAIPEEGYIVTARGMNYVHIPVPFDAPNAEHLKTFLDIMSSSTQKKVWVHCVVNKRASAFLYQYQRLKLGYSDEQARKIMLPGWQPDHVWQEFMALEISQSATL